MSYAFCKRFPPELCEEIFEHILNKALNHRAVDPSMVFIDGTHIKASANKKKFQKEQVKKAAKVYANQLREEVNAEREALGKKPIEDEDDTDDNDDRSGGETVEKTVSTTDPDCGMFVKGEHERQFAYEAHTACDRHGYVLGVDLTAGNVHDSVAWDDLYNGLCKKFFELKFVTMDAGYKTPWIAKKTLEGGKIPILPYTRYKGSKEQYKPWEYTYDPANETFTCPNGGILRHTTTNKDGRRTYRSTPKHCANCPYKAKCGANEKGQKLLMTHIWQEHLDLVEQLRKTDRGKEIYAMRKETIERVFADAKEKHAMRYTHHRGLPAVTRWVKLGERTEEAPAPPPIRTAPPPTRSGRRQGSRPRVQLRPAGGEPGAQEDGHNEKQAAGRARQRKGILQGRSPTRSVRGGGRPPPLECPCANPMPAPRFPLVASVPHLGLCAVTVL